MKYARSPSGRKSKCDIVYDKQRKVIRSYVVDFKESISFAHTDTRS